MTDKIVERSKVRDILMAYVSENTKFTKDLTPDEFLNGFLDLLSHHTEPAGRVVRTRVFTSIIEWNERMMRLPREATNVYLHPILTSDAAQETDTYIRKLKDELDEAMQQLKILKALKKGD